MQHQLHTEIVIDATPERVWEILTDLPSYHSWNPFIIESGGDVVVGQRLTNRLQLASGKAQTFTPTVTVVDPGKTFEWLGRLGFPGIFDGRHRFDLEPTADGGTHLRHREFFSGVLVRLLRSRLDTDTRKGFELMNQALKERAEATVETRP